MAFHDAEDALIGGFSPSAEGEEDGSVVTRSLLSRQTIIGIYGVKDEARHFTSLGFITKENTSGSR